MWVSGAQWVKHLTGKLKLSGLIPRPHYFYGMIVAIWFSFISDDHYFSKIHVGFSTTEKTIKESASQGCIKFSLIKRNSSNTITCIQFVNVTQTSISLLTIWNKWSRVNIFFKEKALNTFWLIGFNNDQWTTKKSI